ncbi:MAG: folate-binding protein YgfZ [Methylococcales symbiont of Hymedesmia sp. n. MRB-2018]|nr:MAG: folate-binding protein YgfZ [Methylococcales symbiont of Hymedesmia sp. n. MRB-2018]KAF3982807.1 MAG: folate-binding protein YgfZ [Methylococcales symbiont of Hymedesmia sp. n. MRB-2018]
MNNEWFDFLNSNKTIPTNNSRETLAAISDLAIIEVTGKDAAQFLQGQFTCDINDLTTANSFFGAFCNAKGRTISTLLILKNNDSLLIIVPLKLIDKVINKLKMYILRADVQLNNVCHKFCLIGLNTANTSLLENQPPVAFGVSNTSEIIIKLPFNQHLYLVVADFNRAKQLWTQFTKVKKLSIADSNSWGYQSISTGLSWLDEQSSEKYIPQMLNIDKLGGISFEKGCYTGQEIVARTHFLGKAKRELYLAECDITSLIDKNTNIFSYDKQQSVGKIISLQSNKDQYRILVVIATESALNKLVLDNPNQDRINILDF